jgi:hypothetical protein
LFQPDEITITEAVEAVYATQIEKAWEGYHREQREAEEADAARPGQIIRDFIRDLNEFTAKDTDAALAVLQDIANPHRGYKMDETALAKKLLPILRAIRRDFK